MIKYTVVIVRSTLFTMITTGYVELFSAKMLMKPLNEHSRSMMMAVIKYMIFMTLKYF